MKLFFYFSLFFIIQLVNSDLDTLTLYLLIKKIILSLLASVLFYLFYLSLIKRGNNMRNITTDELALIHGAGLDKDASVAIGTAAGGF